MPLTPTVKHPNGTFHNDDIPDTIPEDELSNALVRVQTKDLLHAETESSGAGWYVEIISDAKCSRTFAGFVKGFLKNSHAQLQHKFIERLREVAVGTSERSKVDEGRKGEERSRLRRRRSSVL